MSVAGAITGYAFASSLSWSPWPPSRADLSFLAFATASALTSDIYRLHARRRLARRERLTPSTAGRTDSKRLGDRRTTDVQNRTVMVACIVIIVATSLSILLSRHVAPRNGWAIALSIVASVRLFQESRKPKFRRSVE